MFSFEISNNTERVGYVLGRYSHVGFTQIIQFATNCFHQYVHMQKKGQADVESGELMIDGFCVEPFGPVEVVVLSGPITNLLVTRSYFDKEPRYSDALKGVCGT